MTRRLVSSSCLFLLSALFLALVFGLSGCGGSSPATVTIVKPSSTNVDPGQSVTLTVNVTNDSKGVTWSMTGTGCTGTGCGTLTDPADTATYTAPSTVATAFTVTITATAVGQTTKSSSVTLNIPANPAITTAGGALTAGQVGSTYTVTLGISGGISPYTWSVTQGNLPTGLTIGSSTGVISGIPTASGTYNFTLKVADSGSPALTATAQFSIAIAPAAPIVFTTTSLASATYNVAYTATVAATGGAGALTYKVTTGSLPAGLTMSSAGAISGSPTAAGTANFTVTASDAYGDSAQQALSITVNYPAIVISPAAGALPGGQYKVAYSQNLTATGGSGSGYTWSVTSGAASLTAVNLSVSSSGAITGTPQATGNASFTAQVTDSYGDTQTASYTIAVTYPTLSITSAVALHAGMVGVNYTPVTLAATGGSGSPYTWSVTSGTALSATSLALSSGGVISGTPSAAEAAATVTVQVEDSASNKATATFSLTIYSALTITSTTLPNGTYGAAYSTNLAATGGDGSSLTWSTTSGAALTSVGLTLSSAGVLSGTLPAPQNAPAPNCQSGKAYCLSLSVTAVDSDNAAFTTTASAALTIVYPALAVSTSTLPSAVDGTLYSQQLSATGGSGTGYTWTTTGTNNLSTFNLALSTAGVLSGTPPASTTGTATFTAKVTDSFGDTATANLSVTVNGSLTITTATLPYATTGVLYSQTLAASGGSGGYTWSTTGASNLATFNLTLSSAGLLSGTPGSTGTVSFTAQVKDSNGTTATAPFSFAVYNPLSQNSTGLPLTGTTGVSYSGAVTAVGGSGNYSWTVTGLSDDLTQSASGGTLTISGTPGSAATVAITVKLTDTTTTTSASDNYSIVISNPAPLTLPSPNPTSLGSATVNQSYTGAINVTGGVSPYTWKINGTTVTNSGVTLSDGLTATNNGGNTLSVGGTPTSTGSVTLTNVTVTDSESTPVTAGPDTYT
ncbi:MAG: putative Ig domain-containing protein, partial [Acidobacteriaceae bacterium]